MWKLSSCIVFLWYCIQATEHEMLKNAAIGAAAGSLASTAVQPFFYWKNKSQQNMPFSKNPLHWFRGLPINISGYVPRSAVQNTTFSFLNNKMQDASLPLEIQKLIPIIGAGFASSTISGPRELLITQQQNNGGTCFAALASIIKNYGIQGLLRGIQLIIARDITSSAALFYVHPVLKKRISEKIDNATIQTIAPGMAAGMFSALATQPLDTVKTNMQGTMNNNSIKKVAQSVYYGKNNKPSFFNFYRGTAPRLCGVVITMTIMSTVLDYLNNLIK
ncbi:MAG: MC/SLC25 family protein [Candidatus Babeliales bacterium]